MEKRFDFSPVNQWMKSYVEKQWFVGSSVLVAVRGNILFKNHCGLRRRGMSDPFDFDTVARIYSMTKPITSFALMLLVDQGKLDLNTPLHAFIPDFGDCVALVDGAQNISEVEKVPCPKSLSYLFGGISWTHLK